MSNKSFIGSGLFLIIALLAMVQINSRGVPEVLETNLENLPMQIGAYKAVKDHFTQSVYDELNADKNVYRHYYNPDGQVIDLYIGYYGTAKGGRTGHNPYACLPAAGWGIVKDNTMQIYNAYKEANEDVNYTIARKGELFNVMLYWYQSDGTKVLGSGIEQNLHRFFTMVMQNRNDGAFVRISALTQPDRTGKTIQELKRFSEQLLLLLPEYWPEEGVGG